MKNIGTTWYNFELLVNGLEMPLKLDEYCRYTCDPT